eukprot:756486-Hanusia_phi.AAC.3
MFLTCILITPVTFSDSGPARPEGTRDWHIAGVISVRTPGSDPAYRAVTVPAQGTSPGRRAGRAPSQAHRSSSLRECRAGWRTGRRPAPGGLH